jgi:hypothetical protein
VRATCTFPSADVSFMRAVVAATREQNAKALNVTDTQNKTTRGFGLNWRARR